MLRDDPKEGRPRHQGGAHVQAEDVCVWAQWAAQDDLGIFCGKGER